MILISNHVIDKWVREKVVNGVDLAITLLGHLFFLVGVTVKENEPRVCIGNVWVGGRNLEEHCSPSYVVSVYF